MPQLVGHGQAQKIGEVRRAKDRAFPNGIHKDHSVTVGA
jgi:hypothetical protein